MHILIVKHGALGDVVRTSYFAQSLREKLGNELRLSWITSPVALSLIRFNPYIDDIFTSFEDCKKLSFDIIFSLDDEEDVLRNVNELDYVEIEGAYIDEHDKTTYSSNTAGWFDMGLLSHHGKQKADELKKQNVNSHAAIFSNIFNVEYPTPDFWGLKHLEDKANNMLGKYELVIGINPYAGGRWPSKELLDSELELLIELIMKENKKACCIVLLGAGEDFKKNLVLADKLDKYTIIVPDTSSSILYLSAIIKQLDYMISSDSLALHLAIAQKIPFLSFFTATSANEIDDFGLGVKLISQDEDYCSYKKNANNTSITAYRIYNAMQETHIAYFNRFQKLNDKYAS